VATQIDRACSTRQYGTTHSDRFHLRQITLAKIRVTAIEEVGDDA
jgi:hypothetical protein